MVKQAPPQDNAQTLPRILVVDDDPIVAESIADMLDREGYVTATAGDGREALQIIEAAGAASFGVVVADVNMPRIDGMELLKQLREKHPTVVPIMITGFGKIEAAVDAIKLGACDYLTKPLVDDELRMAVSKAVNQHTLVAENKALRSQLSERFGLGNLVGSDYRMQKVYDLISAVAASRTTVLVTGESGTGKSMVGRAIHTLSDRSGGPFVTFSCGAIPETLLESELFGHRRGAFTGADSDKPGKCLAANGGTLFIDEINSATPALQLKLLRVLQEKAFEPVGSTQTQQVDVRFVLATNEPLSTLVEQGTFREDLYYRINVVNIAMPPLRDRPGDIQLLAEHFLDKFAKETGKSRKLGRSVLELLRRYPYPGNVRELENAIERAVVLSGQVTIEPGDLPESMQQYEQGGVLPPHARGRFDQVQQDSSVIPAEPMPLAEALREPERRIILAALQANDWNRQDTARQLDINRTTLYKKIKQLGLDEPA